MTKFLKVIAASIVVVGFASVANAGTVSTTHVHASTSSYSTTSLVKTSNKKVIRKVERLPQARKVATHSTRTVLFYNPSASRSKIIRNTKSKTITPNLFN